MINDLLTLLPGPIKKTEGDYATYNVLNMPRGEEDWICIYVLTAGIWASQKISPMGCQLRRGFLGFLSQEAFKGGSRGGKALSSAIGTMAAPSRDYLQGKSGVSEWHSSQQDGLSIMVI